MKAWKRDELAVALGLGGVRQPLVRPCDVVYGRWRLDLRRRRWCAAVRWLTAIEGAAGGQPAAVVVHDVELDRWAVVLTLDDFRRLVRAAGEG